MSPPSSPSAANRPGSGLRILVVDDHRDSADGLALLLTASRFQVSTAYGAAAALEMLPEAKPQVVITDLSMPGMDGRELAAAIRTSPAGADAMVIALSGYEPDDGGAFDHVLRKPLDLEELQRLLEGC